MQTRKRKGVIREEHGRERGASRIREQQQLPRKQERNERSERIAKIGVGAAVERTAGGEFGVDESADEGDQAAEDPARHDEPARMCAGCNDGRRSKDAGADDGADRDEREIENAEPSYQRASLAKNASRKVGDDAREFLWAPQRRGMIDVADDAQARLREPLET